MTENMAQMPAQADGPEGSTSPVGGVGRSRAERSGVGRSGVGRSGAGRPWVGRSWVGLAFRLVLAAVMIYAGAVKLFEPNGAREAIAAYRLIPESLVDMLGWALPIGQVVLGLLLLVGLFTRLAALAAALLMGAVAIGVAIVWARGYSIDCGLLGGGAAISEEGRAWHYAAEILRDLLLAGMAAWLVRWPRTPLSLDAHTSGEAFLEMTGALPDA